MCFYMKGAEMIDYSRILNMTTQNFKKQYWMITA